MKIEGQLGKGDYVKAYRLDRRTSGFYMPWMIFFNSYIVFMLCRFRLKGEGGLFFVGFAVLAACLLLSMIIDRRWIPRKLRQRPESEVPVEIEINADGITTGTPDGKESVSWLRLHKYRIGKDMTLLYRYGGESLIFPDRWFTPLEKVEFERYLLKEIGGPAR